MCKRKGSSHVEAIMCETSAEVQKEASTGTSVLQENQKTCDISQSACPATTPSALRTATVCLF